MGHVTKQQAITVEAEQLWGMSNNRSPFWKDLTGLCTGAICCISRYVQVQVVAVQGTLYVVMHYYRPSKATFCYFHSTQCHNTRSKLLLPDRHSHHHKTERNRKENTERTLERTFIPSNLCTFIQFFLPRDPI